MTAAEFRLIVDAKYRHGRTIVDRTAAFAADRGFRPRTVRAWYYDERPVPDYVARTLRPPKGGNAQLNAAISMLALELDSLGAYRAAVERMCITCEPSGLCRQADCPLRPVSPMRLAPGVAA